VYDTDLRRKALREICAREGGAKRWDSMRSSQNEREGRVKGTNRGLQFEGEKVVLPLWASGRKVGHIRRSNGGEDSDSYFLIGWEKPGRRWQIPLPGVKKGVIRTRGILYGELVGRRGDRSCCVAARPYVLTYVKNPYGKRLGCLNSSRLTVHGL